MDYLVLFAIVATPIAGGMWYYRAYKEALKWREVHAAWGVERHNRAIIIHHELTRQGIPAQLKASGGITTMMRPFTQPHASIRVRREDFDRAVQVVRSLTPG